MARITSGYGSIDHYCEGIILVAIHLADENGMDAVEAVEFARYMVEVGDALNGGYAALAEDLGVSHLSEDQFTELVDRTLHAMAMARLPGFPNLCPERHHEAAAPAMSL